MTATHKKITIGAGQTAGQATSYLADPQATGDYYSEADHAFMRWIASERARTVLGLNDQVELWKVERLLNGQHPVSGHAFRRWGPDGTMVGGHDVTVSPAPKSVSVLWALADPDLRAEIELMVVQAADVAVQRMLRRVALIRERYGPGKNDVRHVKADDYVGIQALHTTARITEAKPSVPDPDLHVHNVLMGAVDAKGNLRAIDSLGIKNYRAELGAHASADLAERLRLRGFEIERELIRDAHGNVKRVAWEVKGVPRDLIKAMSSRSQEIDQLKRSYRELFGREPEGVHFERFLLNHRGPKSKRTADELREAWIEEGREHDYGPETVAAEKAHADARLAAGIPERLEPVGPEADQFRLEILADLTREHALVPKRQLDKLGQQRAMGLLDPNTAGLVIAEMFGDGDLLMTSDGQRVTTLATLAAEQRAIEAADKLLRAPSSPPADPERLEAEFREREENGDPFDEAQRQAIALATSGARFVSITGPAGAGKGYASRAMVDLWHSQGRRVLALAVAGRTSQQAAVDSGADDHYTLDGLNARLDYEALQLRPTDVLLVDEAAMVDHRRYVPLLEAAVESGATLVQVGDDKQLSPVEAGGLWTVTHAMAAERDVAVELRTIQRARNPAEAEAWTHIRNGDVEKGLLWYRDQERLRLYDSRPELLRGIVEEWAATDRTGVMVVDTTNTERDSVNRLAQAKRLEAGELSAEALALANGREIRAGDRLLFNEIHQLNRDLNPHGPRIENGTPATVLSLATVELDDRSGLYAAERGQRGHQLPSERGVRGGQYPGEVAAQALPAPNVAVVQLHEPAGDRQVTVGVEVPVELGYARHVYKAQGMSAEVANVATGSETSRERLYVMVSRSREGTQIHALRAEVEELGADPASLEPSEARHAEATAPSEPVQVAQTSEAISTPPSGEAEAAVPAPAPEPVTAAELLARIAENQAAREANAEYATIRRISDRAQPEAKQAIGPATWSQPTEPRATEQTVRRSDRGAELDLRGNARADFDLNSRRQSEHHHERATSAVMKHTPSSDEIRQQVRERLQERLDAINQATEERTAHIPPGMPART
ncbi:MAG: relaxase domain-containing protein, partial [Candidatus Dormibacteraeota bacterium]|nr:relaxase domain-containing protein [Candidatus Dormibacteraeota bacterium]